MKKAQFLLPVISLIFLSCATGRIKLISTSGDASLKDLNRQVIGISRMLADEQDAMKDAFAHALSQISSFNGIAIAEEYSEQIIDVARTGQKAESFRSSDSLNIKRNVFTKSFVRLFRIKYYIECYRQNDSILWKAYAYIPYDQNIQRQFLQSLIEGYQHEIEYVENALPNQLENNPARYIDGVKEVLDFYTSVLSQSEGYFMEANEFTIFLKQKIQKLKSEINQFYDHLTCQYRNEVLNELSVTLLYRDKPIQIDFGLTDLSTPSINDTFSITCVNQQAKIHLKPLKSGRTTLRISLASAKFSDYGISKFFDLIVDLKLNHRFTGKKIGIAIYDTKNKQLLPETSSLLGKLISNLEGSSFTIQPGSDAVMLDNARTNNCNLLITGEVEILDNRFNPQQSIYIAFPSFYLKIYNVEFNTIIFQNSYPNDKIKINDMREFGNDSTQALKNGQSLRNLFQNKLFVKELYNL